MNTSAGFRLVVSALCAAGLFMTVAVQDARAQWFQVRNTSGGASPNQPGTVYLGDTGLTFGCDAWGSMGGQWGAIQIYIHTGTDVHNGTVGAGNSFSPGDTKSNTSGKFTSTGTWYWGARLQYNTSGTIVGWYARNRSFWSDAWGTPVSDLSLTVSALNNPSAQVANRNTTNPSTEVNLTWTRGTSGSAKDTLILRKTSAITTDPTGGTAYSVGNTIDSATVIYKSSGTSFTDSSLSGDTQYFYEFYAINNDYYSTGVTANHVTLATEPGSSPNTLSFSSVATSSMTINWANVSTQVLVVVRSGSDLSHDPGDTTNYTANAALGSGTALGGGSVVYKGNGTSVNVTGLSADTRYYVRIYNMRGGGGTSENYRVSDELAGDRYTLATEPSGHVSGFSANAASQTQIDLSWTAAAGPPTGYIILQRTGAAPTGSPADGTGYSVGNSIGDGTVAAIVTPGSSTSANITGLSAGTTYHFTIFPYNGSTAQAYNYRTAATVPSANATTPVNPPTTPSSVAASDGTNTTYVFISWNDSIGETGYVIWRNTTDNSGSAIAIFTNTFSDLDHNDTTASPGQLYYYWVTATNTGGSSAFSSSDSGYRKLATVTGVDASDGTSAAHVALTWDNITGETGFGIYRHTADVSGSATYLASTAADTLTYNDTSATAGQTYYYWIRATNNTSDSESDFSASDSGFKQNLATYEWDAEGGGDRDWSTAANWTGDTEPTIANEAYIGNAFTAVVSVANERAAQLNVGMTGYGIAGTVEQTGGDLVIATNLNLGVTTGDSGTYRLTGGRLTVSNAAFIGDSGDGSFTIDGGAAAFTVGGNMQVGDSDANNDAFVYHNAGTVTVANLYLGRLSGTEGDYIMTGGVLSVGTDIFLADGNGNSTGRLDVSGGRVNVGNINVGRNGQGLMHVSGVATVNVVGSNSDIILGDLSGNNNSNTLRITGGKVNVGDNIEFGDSTATYGELLMSGGSLHVTGQVFVGDAAASTGKFEVAGGTVTIDGSGGVGLVVGNGNGSRGTFNMYGGSMTIDDAQIGVQSGARGFMTMTGGTFQTTVNFVLGTADNTGTGVLHIVGSGPSLTVGDGTTEDFTMQGTASELKVTFVDSTIATITVQDDITVAGTLTVNASGAINPGSYTILDSGNNSAIGTTFSAINWVGGYTGTVSYAGGSVVLTFTREIAVSGNGTDIADGDATPSATDHTDFGNALVAGGTVDRTFTVTNSGTINLTLGTVTTSGTHAADFIVTTQPASTVLGGNSAATTFTVQFNPSGTGLREATISFSNNDADENPFNFSIQGYGTAPEIAVSGNGSNIADGDATPSLTDHTDFGSALVAGGTVQRTYTVTNIGNANLALGTISIGGANAGDFSVDTDTTTPLASSNSLQFIIEFDPSVSGLREATISFTTDDGDENPFNFSIQGYGTAPEIAVSGNGNNIADGDATPSTTDHTDFGSVLVAGGTVQRTYTVTNIGNSALALGTISIGGTHAGDFSVDTDTTTPLASSNSLAFIIEFDPSVSGLREATISFTTDDADENPFNFSIQGTGIAPGISNNPVSFAFSTTLGTTPSSVNFGVTNIGTGTLTYDVSTNAPWLTVSPVSGSLGSLAGQQHTVTFAMNPNLQPGVSNALISLSSNATNTPANVTVAWTINAIPNPSAADATASGAQMVKLVWTKDASHDVMIVHRAGAASTAPSQGSAYNVGDSVGSGTVIYKGSGNVLDHVVTAGVTHHYAFYSINNNYYSTGLTDSDTTSTYLAPIVETFSYTNQLGAINRNGGSGWTNAWFDSPDNAGVFTVTTQSQFAAITGYPTPAGNVITGNDAGIFRDFAAITTGRIYAAFMFRTDNGGGSQYSGLSFFDNGTEERFYGEGFSQVNSLTVGGASGHQLANNTDYTIIAMYDFENDVARALLYTNATQSVPATEPGSWHVSENDATVSRINSIRLQSNVGTRWDEIRIGYTYYDALGIAPPGPGLSVGPTNVSVSVMKGATASAIFNVTNTGGATLFFTNTVTYGNGSGWLTVLPANSSVAGGSFHPVTGTVSAVGLAVGSYNATNRVAGNQTNDEAYVIFTVTVTNIPAPTALAAITDGKEMVRVTPTGAGLDVLLVHRSGAYPSADPTDNTAYNVGDSIGSGTVIYKGAAQLHEHVVPPGSTNYYYAYSISGDHYSPSVSAVATTTLYRAGEIVDVFAYTNNASLGSTHAGGQGWSGGWSTNTGVWIVKTNGAPINFTDKPNYPSNAANRIRLNSFGVGNSAGRATRLFATPVTNGTIYVAAHMSYQFGGPNKWMGINFMSNGNARAFFGEISHDDKKLGLSGFGGTNVTASYNMNDFNADTNNTYLVIGAYDFSTLTLKVAAFYRTTTVPSTEPATWDAYGTVPSGQINMIDGIRLYAGCSDGGWLGDAYYDEIRVATSWDGLLGKEPTYEWDAGGGSGNRDWSTAANWTSDTEPFAGTNAYINGGYTGVVSAAGEAANNLIVGGPSPSSGTGTGRLEQTGGSLSVNNFYMGFGSDDRGTYVMSGGALTVAVDMAVGYSGVATAQIHGANSKIVIGNNLEIGFSNANNRVRFIQGGGTVSVNRIYLGKNSGTEGYYSITNGVLNVLDDVYLADGNGNSTGRMVIAGNGVVNVADEYYAGRNGQGILAVRDSGVLNLTGGTGHLEISDLSGNNNNNLVQLGGGTISVGGDVKVADAANSYGSLVVSNGTLGSVGDLYVANNATATGVLTIVGGFIDPDDFYVGYLGNGAVTMTGGSVTADQFEIGFTAGSIGAMTMSGGEVHIDGTLFNIGAAGVGSLTLSGGTIYAGDGSGNTDVSLGSSAGGSGVVYHNGGSLIIVGTTAGSLSLGGASQTGIYRLSDGSLDLSNGDDILINNGGTLELVGANWSATVDDDFTMAAGSTLAVVFSNGIERVVVDTDVTVAGTLNVTNVGSIADGTYVIVTSITRSVTGTFATTNWHGGYTGTVSYADGRVAITFVTAAEIAVLGTNYAEIASGDFVPSTADGTDFGDVAVAASTVTRTFFITNLSGGASINISGVTTSGTAAADFTVLSWPTTVDALSVSNLTVQFDPSAVGLRTAVVVIANDDSNENPYTFTIQGTGTQPGISNNPTVFNISSTLGNTPSSVSFGVTNIGTGTLNYDISTNAGWLTVSPVAGSIGSLAGQQHTVTFATLQGFQSGVSNATITVTGATASNSPQTVVVNWTINAIAVPTSQTATKDGKEMIRLAWTKDASYDVMIIHDTAAISTEPSQGTSYAVGDTIGTGRVIYKGSGAALEHIVAANSANHYKFYSINNNYYSPGVSANDTTDAYQAGEIVDQFAYTNAVPLGGRGTGLGWTNNWAASAPNATADIVADSVNFATFQQYWPSERANRVVLKTTNSSTYTIARNFAGITGGKFYVAFLYRREFNEGGDGKFSGARILQGTAEVAFVGERGGAAFDDIFGVSSGAGNNTYGATDSFPAATDYLVIGRYDFDNDTIAGIYYTSAQSVPATEPTFFTVATNASITRIDGVQLVSGATSGWNGQTHFDELRIATSWAELLRLTQPSASAYVINGGNNVTDGQVANGTFSVQYDFYDANGLTNSASIPSFDIWNSTGSRIIASNTFSTLTYSDSGRALRGSNTTHTGVSASSVTLGVYTSRWTAANSNGVFVYASQTLSNGTVTTFTVVDDDTAVPEVNFIQSTNNSSSRNLHISLGASQLSTASGSSTNIAYNTTDGVLAGVASSGPLIFWFGARDADSGLARSTANPETNTSFSIGSAIVSNVANFDVSRSTPAVDTTAVRPTNSWTWTSAFTPEQIDNLVTNTALGYGTNAVRATIRDGDLDRGATDQLSLHDQQVGILVVTDDDVAGPVFSGFRGNDTRVLQGGTFTNLNLGSGLIITGLVNDADSGVYGGTSNSYALTRDGSPVDSGTFAAGFSNGGNGSLSNTISSGIITVAGVYTLTVYSVDYDIDRPGDSSATTSNYIFTVVEPPQAPGLAVSPATLTYHVILGGTASNNTFTVSNIGSGSLIYTNDQTYGANGSGWFSAVPTEYTNGTLMSRIHTGVVTMTSISAVDTYVATNRVAGNQTNSAQSVVVTVVVTNIPEAQSLAAVADGPELIRLSATEAAGRSVIIVHSTSAFDTAPTNGTAFNVGDVLGNGTVIFKFIGSSTPTNVEHIVPAGSANFYNFYAINNDYYSTGTPIAVTTASYDGGELVDQFAYTNALSINGRGTGQGWTNTWTVTAPHVAADVQITSNNFIGTIQPEYPAEKANYLIFRTTNSSTYVARRNFAGYSSGKIYVAAAYRRAFNEGADGKFSGIRMVSGATEEAFFGERGGAANDDVFGVSSSGNVNNYGASDSFPAATEYLMIGKYDFDTDVLEGIFYTTAQAVPSVEPTFFVSVTNAITHIDGIELVSGATSGWNGDVHFDEIRVASTWQELLRLGGGPVATNYNIGGNATNYVTDGAVRSGVFPVVMRLESLYGVETTNTITPFFLPNFDLWSAGGIQILTNKAFASFTYENSGRTVLASNASHVGMSPDGIVLGTYTSRFSAIASNSAVTIDRAHLSNGTAMAFTVFDDDSVAPVAVNITSPNSGASRQMHLSTNNASVSPQGASSGSNITYVLSDAALTNISGGSPLVFYFGASDPASGIARGNDTALTNSSLTIGAPGGVISNVFNWDATRSSTQSETMNSGSTNAWSWIGAMLPGEVDFLVTNTVSGVMGSNRVTLTWRDADSDRPNDQTTQYDQQHGWLVVNDDDTTGVFFTNFTIRSFPVSAGSFTVSVAELQSGAGWGITGRVSDAGSGINVNGSSLTQPDISPYFELWDPSGVMRLRQVFDTISFAHGGATTLSPLGSYTNSSIAIVSAGTWTARVVVADADNDRTSDRIVVTNEFAFEVVAGASQTSMQVSPTILNVTSTYGSVAGDINWPHFTVTNNGIGSLIYSATIGYSGGSGWLTVDPNTAVNVGAGLSQIHTAAVNAASLNPGNYQATVNLIGNQTNGTKTVTVNLTVIGYYVNEIVDQFTNTAGGGLSGTFGGSGWTNNWSTTGSISFDSSSLSVPVNYPTNLGNRVCGSSASEILADRSFPAFTTGKIFVAVAIQKDANNNNGYIGVSFLNGGSSIGYFGKIFNSEWLGLDGTNSSTVGNFGLYQSTYLIVGYYDFDTHILRTRAYNPGDTMPLTEPSGWAASNNYTMTRIDGIRLGAQDVGNACFDEVRVATSWESLLNQFNAEPTLQAFGMSFTNVTTNAMTVGWNNGNGGARIVVAREGAAVSFTPTDGVNYSANADFTLATDLGSGNKVIFNGSGNSVNLSGLLEQTNYFFKVYEYNGSGASADYLTTGTPLTGSRWTLKSEPSAAVTNLVGYTISESAISNTWTAVTNTPEPDGYLILRQIGSVPSYVPIDGVGYTNNQLVGGVRILVVTNGTDTTFRHEGLAACSTYNFVIYPYRRSTLSAETINYYTNTPGSTSAPTDCTEPSIQASNIVFSSIGTNTITLAWNNGDGEGRIVVVRGTNAVNQLPVDGTVYTANSFFGSGSHLGDGNYVVFAGTSATVSVLGLAPGVTYHFRVFEYNGSGLSIGYNTNTANLNPRSTATAAFGLVEDKFGGYSGNLFGENGGTGWTNSWGTLSGQVDVSGGSFGAFGAYPADSGTDKVYLNSVTKRSAWRSFPAMTSGKFLIAMKLNVGTTVQNAFFGINLLNGAAHTSAGDNNVVGFVGKAYGVANNQLTLVHNSNVRTNRIDGSNAGYTLNSGSGNDYLMVAEYDFDAKTFKARAYTSDNVAHSEPDRELAWVVEMTNVNISAINGIEVIGEGLGDTYFDHIRIGPSWEEVMWNLRDNHHRDNGPTPTLVFIGTNYNAAFHSQVITNLSDAELKSSGNIDFAVRWDSSTGVFTTNSVSSMAITNIGSNQGRVNPNWDPLAVGVASNQFNLDKFFTNYFGFSGANVITSYHKAAFNITNINFEEQYFVTVSAENYPGGTTVTAPNGADPIPVTRAITINEPMRFYVYDDDTNNPTMGAGGLVVMTNLSIASFQDVNDQRQFEVTDGSLASNGMDISLHVYDSYSGLQRSTADDASTNMSLTVSALVTSNTTMFSSTRSSANSQSSTASNLWSFASSNFTFSRISAMWGGDGSGVKGQFLNVEATVPDADEDRVSDQSVLSNALFGLIRLADDDVGAPVSTNITYGLGTVNNRPFYVATNGFSPGSGEFIRGTYARRGGTGIDTIFSVTDAELADPAGLGLEFAFGVRDTDTGISRATSGSTNEVMSFSIGTVVTGVVEGFNATLSSGSSGPNVLQTNVWTFANGFYTENVITTLMALTESAQTPAVYVTVPDADNDRVNDRSILFGDRVGYLDVYDDDVAGPTLSGVEVPESTGGDTIIATSFETSQNWPITGFGSSIATNVTDGFGTWYTEGILYTSLDPKNTGSRRLGFLTNDFPTPWLQLPPVNNPGTLFLYGARVGGGSGAPKLRVERYDVDTLTWVSYGDQNIDTTAYMQYSWDIDEPGTNLLLRVRRVDGVGIQRTQIYMDDISLTARSTWISTNQIRINWPTAVDDFSGLDEYRFVPPAEGAVAPAATNDGSQISGAVTTTVQSILGYQGVITGYIFAIDNDNDRSNDRSMGNVAPIIVRVDTNPPLAVGSADTVVDSTIDDSEEIKVTWTNVVAEALAAGWRQSDSAALSPWDTYVIRYHELDISTPVTTELTRANTGLSGLSSHTFTNLIISNLNFDASYRITIQGRDDAGNLGPMVTVTGITTIFSVTQGFNRVDRDLEVRWIWNEERTYDIVYADYATMTDSLTNMWDWVTTITNAGWMTDTGAVDRTRPLNLGEDMRFYRVSRQNAWLTNNTTRRGSVEVYVTKPLNLYTGENWHSLFFLPDTATVAYVFNTNILPAADNYGQSTKISWFGPSYGGTTNQSGVATAVVWLADSGNWTWHVGGVGNANDKLVPLDQGFLLEIPGNASATQDVARQIMVIGRVPTQEVEVAIGGGSSVSNNIFVLSHNMPVRTYLTNMGFRGSGFYGNNNGSLADEIRILAPGGNGSLENPKARIRLRTDGVTWQYYTAPAAGEAGDPRFYIIDPDDAVVIIRRNSTPMVWTNKVWYSPPTKNFAP